jgi:hypothetical protein
MDAGADPARAVHIAAARDIYSGGEVTHIRLHPAIKAA